MARKRFLIVILTAAVLLGIFPGLASAAELGEDVDYDLVFPVDGTHEFSDTFWAGRSHGFHTGQDIMAAKMTPVVAVAAGIVRLVNWSSDPKNLNARRCCTIVVTHDDGWESWYIHLNNDTPGTDDGEGWGVHDGIVPGTRVEAGEHIGWVGDSGNAENTPPHIHFELRDPSGTIVNPYSSLVSAGGNDVGSGPRDPLVDGARVLSRGLFGADIRALQVALENLGHSVGGIDGRFGPQTEVAVKAFQAGFGIVADGLVGRATRTALAGIAFQDDTGGVLSVGSRGEAVRTLQTGLKGHGFEAGPSDGIFGPLTLRAVLSFQKHERLWVDGLVGPRTRAALGIR